MPWTKKKPPNVAKNWTEEEKEKCVKAAKKGNEMIKEYAKSNAGNRDVVKESNEGKIDRALDFLNEKMDTVFDMSLELIRKIEPIRVLSPERPQYISDDNSDMSEVEARIYGVTIRMENLIVLLGKSLDDIRL
jgi:hypothetical protein